MIKLEKKFDVHDELSDLNDQRDDNILSVAFKKKY